MADAPESVGRSLSDSEQSRCPDLPLIVSAPPEEIRWTHRKERIELALAVLVLICTGIIPAFILYHEHLANERQADSFERQAKAIALKTSNDIALSQPELRISQAQLAASLLPSLTKGAPNERGAALLILRSAAPDLADRIPDALKSVIPTKGGQSAVDINQLSIQVNRGQDFVQHLEQARVMQGWSDFAQADREYMRAFDVRPSRFNVDAAKYNQAKALYDSDSWEAAARLFDEAFGEASAQ